MAFGRRTSRRLSPSSVQMFTTTQHFTGFVYTQESFALCAHETEGPVATRLFDETVTGRMQHCTRIAGRMRRTEPHVAERFGPLLDDQTSKKASKDAENVMAMMLAMALQAMMKSLN